MITLQERVHGSTPPTDWRLNKLHNVLRVRKRTKNTGMRENNLLSLSYGRIVRKDIDSAEGLLPESFETYQIVESGNIVMRLTDLQNDKRSLRQGLVMQRGIITSAYDALEVGKDSDPRFWAYALLALDLAKYYYSLGGGVRQSVKFSDFPNEWLATPDAQTQESIADFLDRETARIDLLIEKKQKFLEILFDRNERLTSKLLDESGLSVQPQSLRWLVRVRSGDFISNEEIEKEKNEVNTVPVIGGNGILAYTSRGNSPAGTIVVGRVGALCGNVHFIADESWVTDNALVVRVISKDIEPLYLAAMLKQANLNERASKSAQPLITGETVKSLKVRLPSLDTQAKICAQIARNADENQTLLGLIKSSIARLAEFRSALITAAVTGQIEVAAWSKQGYPDRRLEQIEEEMTEREGAT